MTPDCPLDSETRKQIEKAMWVLLREAGETAPPVNVPRVAEHLRLYRDFYDLQNPTFLERTKHKLVVHGRRLAEIVQKVRLAAVLLYDEDRIVIDVNMPKIKHDWSTCHEIGHRGLTWHKTYYRADTAETLDPEWHERLEAEANYAASEIMFCGPVFGVEARSVRPTWDGYMSLVPRYGKSMAATLRRFVEHGPDRAMAMLVSTPSWRPKPDDQEALWRHFVKSPCFQAQFSHVAPEELLASVDTHAAPRAGGPVAEFLVHLADDNGEPHEFYVKSFFNRHYILTLLVELQRSTARRIVLPSRAVL